jgi:hypothetical protein
MMLRPSLIVHSPASDFDLAGYLTDASKLMAIRYLCVQCRNLHHKFESFDSMIRSACGVPSGLPAAIVVAQFLSLRKCLSVAMLVPIASSAVVVRLDVDTFPHRAAVSAEEIRHCTLR